MSAKDWMLGIKQGIDIAQNHLANYHMAIINLKPGESRETAWKRHLAQNPNDIDANIRVFNRFPVLSKAS
jgi:hypothetical protein